MRAAVLIAFVMLVGAAPKAPPVTGWVGKYPFDKVAGTTFLKHPLVVRGVAGALAETAVTEEMLTPGVAGPVQRQGALVVSRSCRPHECGSVNWTIAMAPGTGKAAVCYHNEDLMGAQARWFVGGYPRLSVVGECAEMVPSAVVGILALKSRE